MTRAPEPVPKKTADEIEQEASEWVIRLDGDGSPEAARALEAWLDANPRHRAAFLRISIAWQRASGLRRLHDPTEEPDLDLLAPERPPVEESITEPPRLPPPSARPAYAPRSRARRTVPYALAAGLAACLIGGGYSWYSTASNTYSAAIGDLHRVPLPDGSTMALNTNSRVRVHYSDSERRIELLRGEVQFDVVHDAVRPFVVTAGRAVMRDVGTVFDVRLRSETSIDVLVSQGAVVINSPEHASLTAGQMALVRNGTVTTQTLTPYEVNRHMAWLEGHLIFDGETLSEAVAEFNRYNRRQLVIADPSIAAKKIGGDYISTNPDSFGGAMKRWGIVPREADSLFGSEIRLYGGERVRRDP